MPFIQRIVEPVYVSGVQVEKSISNELECVTNHTLANIVLQLSSLSHHAEDIFADLNKEMHLFFNRASSLNSRAEQLRAQVAQLNATEEVVSLQNIHLRKPYKSSYPHDQQVVSRNTIPKAIQDLYNRCERPPMLDKLNQYREDGRDCMKFYTDPNYFFELWYSEIKKDIEDRKRELKQKRVKMKLSPTGRNVQPRQLQPRAERYKDAAMGEELRSNYRVPDNQPLLSNKPLPDGDVTQNAGPNALQMEPMQTAMNISPAANFDYQRVSEPQNTNYIQCQSQINVIENCNLSPRDMRSSQRFIANNANINNRPSMAPPPPPPIDSACTLRMTRVGMSPDRDSLPPPPPPPLISDVTVNRGRPAAESPHKPIELSSHYMHQSQEIVDIPPPPPPNLFYTAPPPPPPPPPPPLPPPPPQMNGLPMDDISVNSEESSYSQRSKQSEPEPTKLSGRNALLEEIRLGEWNKKLKKTEERQKEKGPSNKFDVHTVMTKAFDMRRKAMEDSESEMEMEMDDEEDDWE